MDMNFFDWTTLGTFAGAVAAVALIVEAIKGAKFLAHIPTQLVSWVLAAVILILSQLFTGALTVQSAVLALVNAVMVSLAANGGYVALKRIVGGKTDSED